MPARAMVRCAAPAALLLAMLLTGCEGDRAPGNGIVQTKFPGQVSAGGATSGEIIARTSRPVTDGTYAGGTPGIAGGSGGTTSGAATAGTVQESGQGPSRGTSQPDSAGQAGTTLPPGDMGKPAGPAAEPGAGGAAVHRDAGGAR
ncbi:hypothetical protein [Pseudoduganella chitinolytica]|uniref:Collagen-like protein n=1 Tax=Pseudoduganella chitinolytica TaxID=34070 RepID=A0ABY8BHB5_9BURK|nr:hypothetical protein [Pseudoduganella chitinolytica]WEF35325.1 hypothetical protein PX653_11390 [Pseudoduganella chitinolytica]